MLSNQEAALLEAASIVRETKTLATHITFQLDFMLLMLNVGRTDEANECLAKLRTLIDKVKG